MSLVKKFAIGLGIFMVLAVIGLASIPFLFKDRITQMAKDGINRQINAKVDFKEVDLSVFRSFPDMSLDLKGLTVEGVGIFEGVPLVKTDRLSLRLDLLNILTNTRPVKIKGFHLEKPFVNVLVLEDGTANYNITKPDSSTATAAPQEEMKIALKKYSISDGHIVYRDKSLGFFTEMEHMNHEGTGNFTSDIYDLNTKTTIPEFTVNYGGIPYLVKAKTSLDAIVNVNMGIKKFLFKENELSINELSAKADGWLQMNGDEMTMDLKFSTPKNDFKSLLSIIPGAYTKEFNKVKASGKFDFAGTVKGTYNGVTGRLPAYDFKSNVSNANIQYPSLPMGITGLGMNARITNPGSNTDATVVSIKDLKMKMGDNPFETSFVLKTPISNPDIDGWMKGIINFSQMMKIFPMEGMESLQGILNADVVMKANMKQIEAKAYESVDMKGEMVLSSFSYHAKGSPAIKISNMEASLTPQQMVINSFTGNFGKSDIQASGKFENILAYFSPHKTLNGEINVSSNILDLNEWMGSPTSENAGPVPQAQTQEKPFNRFQIKTNAKAGKILYDKYVVENVQANGDFAPNLFSVKNASFNLGASDFAFSGDMKNAWDFVFDNGILYGDILFKSKFLDLNQFMDTSTPKANTAAAPPSGVIEIPTNMDIKINSEIGKVKYTNMDLSNVKGLVEITKGEAAIHDGKANALGGSMNIDGLYSTKNVAKPGFDMKYTMNNISFKDAFNTLNTVQKLAPIANYIDGKFNTTMTFSGLMNKDMTPDFASLNVDGFINTINGIVRQFKPVEELGNRLNVSALKTIDLKDSKNWFTIKNGAVNLQEFERIVNKDIVLKIGGTHSITQDMSYVIKSRIPKKYITSNNIGAQADAVVGKAAAELSKLGVNLNAVGDFININAFVTGSITNPKVNLKFMGTDGQSTVQDAAKETVKALAEKAKDSLRRVGESKLQEGKDKANAALKKAQDSIQRVANAKIKEATDRARSEAEKKIGDAIPEDVKKKAEEVLDKTIKDKAGQIGGDKAKEEADKIKKKVEEWNPFKKKN
jgi:hypothetical protein